MSAEQLLKCLNITSIKVSPTKICLLVVNLKKEKQQTVKMAHAMQADDEEDQNLEPLSPLFK